MTDQPSPALAEAREIVGKMTVPPWPEPELRHGVEWYDIGDIARVLGWDDAAGIVRAVALLRTVVAEKTVEAKAMREAVEFAIYRNADCSARDAERAAPYAIRAVLTALLERAREGT